MEHLIEIQKATGCTFEEANILIGLLSVRLSECSTRALRQDARETWEDCADYVRAEVAKKAKKAAQNV